MGELTDFISLYIEDSNLIGEKTNEIAMNLENNIKREAPYDQGRLKRSIRVDTRIQKTYGLITGYWDEGLAPHGIYVLTGTRPHIIKPKTKKALAWDGMPTDYPLSMVKHPGTKANDFLGRGLEKTLEAYR